MSPVLIGIGWQGTVDEESMAEEQLWTILFLFSFIVQLLCIDFVYFAKTTGRWCASAACKLPCRVQIMVPCANELRFLPSERPPFDFGCWMVERPWALYRYTTVSLFSTILLFSECIRGIVNPFNIKIMLWTLTWLSCGKVKYKGINLFGLIKLSLGGNPRIYSSKWNIALFMWCLIFFFKTLLELSLGFL